MTNDRTRDGRDWGPLSAWVGVAAAVGFVLGLVTGPPAAGAQPARLYCEPECRPGFECQLGECVPACSPPCGSGFLCTEGGRCIAEGEPEVAVPVASQASGDQCQPACRPGYQCVDGACTTACNPACPIGYLCTADLRCIQAPVEETVPPGPTRRLDPSADSRWNLHVDLAGAAQWGLGLTAEGGRKLSGYLTLRPLNAGVLPYFMFTRDEEDRFKWGLGGEVGMHAFTAKRGNRRGFFGGPALGYYYVRIEDDQIDHARYHTHALVPQFDFGYRWAFKQLLLGVGLRFGVSFALAARDEPLGNYGCTFADSCPEERPIMPLPEIFVDLGGFLRPKETR